ncbi:phosphatidylinositol glycan, class A [Cryptococcus gattii E566]|uniref:1-acyl-sn-glycerol-3-phosphate acyltransferase n=2 Tax=Cryptococcus gattii TaxID=37769 RepID=E6R403_CRYGW|nr:Transferase, putative [Cryptococcus gattii WM276]ADV21782.1 Transferase, putative [Cryptococcus gattii WM276]KIR80724.1 phosphatidylinositol glycan, class A [Cryptococcus gattii EJB2]KIY35582.1 phosphatidylinositol glycan, class A [Cryptococcus gattii E566]KJE04430.1 phosphatidylinositol glycan, class A [Cryptococcus gattii NT-10]
MWEVIYYLNLTLYTVLLLSISFVAVLIAVVCSLTGRRLNTNYYVARTFYHVAGPILGWKFKVEGEQYLWELSGEHGGGKAGEKGRSMVMVGNHQSFVDILYLGRIFPKHAAIMAKKSLQWIPGLGWFMMMSGTVFINRSNNKSAIASLQQAGEEMKRKRISLWIFPEGTRHNSPELELLKFKKGAFYLAVQAGVPIVPVVCENYNHLFNGKSHFRRGTLRIKVLPPIPTAGLSTADVPKLIEKTRNAMLQTLQEISTPSPATSQTGSPDPLLGRSGRGREEYYTSGSPVPPEGVSSTVEIGAEEEAEAAVEDAVGREEADNGERHAPVFSQNDRGDETMTTAENVQKSSPKRLAIAMVSDFFFPIIGGVEGHIYSLSVELMRRGHKVIVITHSHPDRSGVHYLSPSLKIYYLPYLPIASSASLPNFLLFLPYFRRIILSENIQLVHGHGALSSLAHEAVLHAPLLGVKAVFTDHSLFGFGDAVGVLTNKLLGAALRCVDEVICVSNTGRENTVLRAQLDPSIVSVIPNALEAEHFKPDPSRADPDWITIVVISRLVHRKGIDLLISSAPQICALFPKVRFIVGGDGPKMVELEQMREKYELQGRIELLGRVNPGDVRDVLTKGQIYLSNSLTEAFGISIIEAASAGLFVVATKVGGVPEILPQDMIEFCRADEDDVIRALTHAIHTIQSLRHSPWSAHIRVRDMYSWSRVASRAEIVYLRAMSRPHREIGERMKRYLELGPVFGIVMCCILAVEHYFFWLLEWWNPRDKIQQVVKFQDVERFEDGGKKEGKQVRIEQ